MARRALPEKIDMTPEYHVTPDLQDNMNALAIHQRDIMEKYGEGLPYERERIVHEARFYMAQSAEAMLEAGKRLIILKENEPHGEFTNILTEQLGLTNATAHRMMQASIKYLSPKLQANLPTLVKFGKSKLYDTSFAAIKKRSIFKFNSV